MTRHELFRLWPESIWDGGTGSCNELGTHRPTVRGYAADAPAAPPVGNPTGWGLLPSQAPRGQKGICYRCHRPGHYVAECPISQAYMDVAVPFTAQQYPHPMHYGGGWVQDAPPGSDGYTATVVSPPQPFSNNSHEQKNDGSCAPTFNPHLLTAQFTLKDKNGRSGIIRGNGRKQWVADSGATFHVTGNPVGMVGCNPPPPGMSTLVVDDMTLLRVLCFGKIPMIMHCKQGDVQVKLLNVAHVLGVQFDLFSLHAVMPKCSASLDAEGVHMLDGVLSLRRDAGSYVEATRVVEISFAAAVLAPGKMGRIDITDLHVPLAHSHADTLRETARQMGIKVLGSWFRVLVVPGRRGGGWRYRGRPSAAPPGLWSVSSWIYRGNTLDLPAVRSTR